MTFHQIGIIVLCLSTLLAGCATKSDFERLESKVDLLLKATKRSTLEEVFGPQASEISSRIAKLNTEQRQDFEKLQEDYAGGLLAVEDVRQQMLGILGNNDRLVSTRHGIYIRDLTGKKIKAVSMDTKLVNCRLMDTEAIPAAIREKQVLERFSWGQGQLDGQTILFPWELTISSFTKEIAEHTARKTAQEFIKMGGGKQWQRPIRIQVSTEKDEQVKITTDEEESEVYFNYEHSEPEPVPTAPAAEDSEGQTSQGQ